MYHVCTVLTVSGKIGLAGRAPLPPRRQQRFSLTLLRAVLRYSVATNHGCAFPLRQASLKNNKPTIHMPTQYNFDVYVCLIHTATSKINSTKRDPDRHPCAIISFFPCTRGCHHLNFFYLAVAHPWSSKPKNKGSIRVSAPLLRFIRRRKLDPSSRCRVHTVT